MSKRNRRRGPARPDPVYRPWVQGLPAAYIFDMDGTLATLGGRDSYDGSTCDRDPIHSPVYTVLVTLAARNVILIVSGRSDRFRPQTVQWLRSYGVPYSGLYMRRAADNRGDALVKAEIFRDLIAPCYNVQGAFDDRNRVVAMWRWLGVPCFQVQEGDF